MTSISLCCLVLAVTVPLGLCALYLRRSAQEARAIRLVLQARWDYDRISIAVRLLESCPYAYNSNLSPAQWKKIMTQILMPPDDPFWKRIQIPQPSQSEVKDSGPAEPPSEDRQP